MTDWTTCRMTPELQAELRRLLDATETPWALWDGYGPDGNGDMRVARIGHLSGSGIRADPDSADIYGRREAFELLASAVNALPALLDAAAERDALAAAVRELTEARDNARAEVKRLTAQVERVRALVDEWTYKGEFGWDDGSHAYGPDCEGQALDYAAAKLRRALDEEPQS